MSLPGDAPTAAGLSQPTIALLQHLEAPVEIRFYSSLDPASVSTDVRAFAERVDQLLAQYEQLGGDKIKLTRHTSDASGNDALADGIQPFNVDQGQGCFLGIAVICQGQKQSLARLSPEWEQAVEPDVTRAIARAVAAESSTHPQARIDLAAVESVKQKLPDYAALSLAEGNEALRNAALADFAQVKFEMEARVKEIQDRILLAQEQHAAGAEQAATEELLKLQSEATEKLKQIALSSHAQIAALAQLKKNSP